MGQQWQEKLALLLLLLLASPERQSFCQVVGEKGNNLSLSGPRPPQQHVSRSPPALVYLFPSIGVVRLGQPLA